VDLVTAAVAASQLDRVTPAYQWSEVHSVTVRASPERAYQAIKEVTAGEILFFRTLTWLRRFGRPGPESVLNAPERSPILDVATRTSFVTLADGPREVVVGTPVIVPPDGVRPTTPTEFLALRDHKGYALATMNFAITPGPDGRCVVSTETRVHATDARSRRRFAAYWRLIKAGSAFIRVMWLRAIKRRAEAEST